MVSCSWSCRLPRLSRCCREDGKIQAWSSPRTQARAGGPDMHPNFSRCRGRGWHLGMACCLPPAGPARAQSADSDCIAFRWPSRLQGQALHPMGLEQWFKPVQCSLGQQGPGPALTSLASGFPAPLMPLGWSSGVRGGRPQPQLCTKALEPTRPSGDTGAPAPEVFWMNHMKPLAGESCQAPERMSAAGLDLEESRRSMVPKLSTAGQRGPGLLYPVSLDTRRLPLRPSRGALGPASPTAQPPPHPRSISPPQVLRPCIPCPPRPASLTKTREPPSLPGRLPVLPRPERT